MLLTHDRKAERPAGSTDPPGAPVSELAEAPFVDEVICRSEAPRTSFHMPGHKQRACANPHLAGLWGEGLFRSDLSEIGGLDYLHAPKGSLRHAQDLAAKAVGADFTFFLVNGSTVGNHASVLGCVGPGQKILLPRASHRSLFAALALSDAVPVFVPPLYHPETGLPLAVDPARIEGLLAENPDVAAVQMTSPSYYGFTSDVAACAGVAHRYGIPLLVDEAHGAHFAFHPDLPIPALRAGADLTVQSTHKTLGSLTQSSMLHGRRRLISEARLQQVLAMLESSSPSALLLASLDSARARMVSEGEALLERAIALAEQARRRIRRIPGLWCYGSDLVGSGGVHGYDPTKLLIRVTDLGWSGFEAADWLAREARIEIELADPSHILCSLTINDTAEDVARLPAALERLPDRGRAGRQKRPLLWSGIPKRAMGMREAAFAPSRACSLRDAVDHVSAESVIPYPPGIPAVLPGEIIDAETVAVLEELAGGGAVIVGPTDWRLRTIRVIAKE